jgi:hypothetical protein
VWKYAFWVCPPQHNATSGYLEIMALLTDIVLWTPIRLGCRDGNGLAIALVSFDVVITGLDDLVLFWECDAISASIASLLVALEVFDLYYLCTIWCPSSSIGAESAHYNMIGTFGLWCPSCILNIW